MKNKIDKSIVEFINKCTITKVGEKYVVQTPMGFYFGSYKTEDEAKAKIREVAIAREN